MTCFKTRSNYALHSKMALIHTSSAMAQCIERLVKCRGLIINRRYEIDVNIFITKHFFLVITSIFNAMPLLQWRKLDAVAPAITRF